jgi:hypothetical protein
MLAIDKEICEKIDAAVARARRNPLPAEEIRKRAVQAEHTLHLADIPPGHPPRPVKPECVAIAFGYTACISFEIQPNVGLCRHLSISRENVTLTPEACMSIATLFGFRAPYSSIWFEEFYPGQFAVNIVQPVNTDA